MEEVYPCLMINFNLFEDCINAVNSALAQQRINLKVYLLDNNSDQFEGDRLKAHFAQNPNVKVICSAENLGFSKGCNLLLSLARKDLTFPYFFLLNPDATAATDWAYQLLSALKSSPLVAIATSKMLLNHNPNLIDNIGHFMLNTGELLPLARGERASDYTNRLYNLGGCGGACAISVASIDKAGFFDETFFVGYEDAELGLRLNLLGYKTVFEPLSLVNHQLGGTVAKSFSVAYATQQQFYIHYTAIKLLPKWFLFVNFPFWVLKYLGVLIFCLITFRKKLLQIQWGALLQLSRNWSIVMEKRKQFYAIHANQISHLEWIKHVRFSMWHDFKKFMQFFIFQRPTNFEKR